MMILLIVMGVGIVWQGTKNLKRDKARPSDSDASNVP